ncbi:hypothetical protein [Neobacillus sp. LXY-4]|uniref:hypothetical protein n=1 Tax=Neobacillus sp. LXY-4 TaxID=3379826 RepID=UPI003EDF89A6
MPRKATPINEGIDEATDELFPEADKNHDETANLSRMLAAVLTYLSDDEIEEIDIGSLLENTEGLQEWWNQYRENNKEKIVEEIKNSLEGLTLKELERIREQIKDKQD